jgi:hypothetical protein
VEVRGGERGGEERGREREGGARGGLTLLFKCYFLDL